jgi:hypothetical protein
MAKKKQSEAVTGTVEPNAEEVRSSITATEIGLKVLIAIPTSAADKELENACRATWAKDTQGVDIVFFDGEMLGVPDGYDDLPIKVQAICKWALERDYDFMLKVDSDTFVWIDRIFASGFEQHDYSGWTGGKVAPQWEYASGGAGYVLSHRAMQIVGEAQVGADSCEDRWVGRVLYDAGIIVHRNTLHAHGRHEEAAEHKVLTMHPCRSLEWMERMRDA